MSKPENDNPVFQIGICPSYFCVKTVACVSAKYTCECKCVYDLLPEEKDHVLGLDNAHDDDFVVSIAFDDDGEGNKMDTFTFNFGGELYNTDVPLHWKWAVVERNNIDTPTRNFVLYDSDTVFLGLHIYGEARLAVTMYQRDIHCKMQDPDEQHIKKFCKEWDAFVKNPVSPAARDLPPDETVKDGELRQFKECYHTWWGVIMPWTEHHKLVIPMSILLTPTTDCEMISEFGLKNPVAGMSVYQLWNTRIVDIRIIASDSAVFGKISPDEYQLVGRVLAGVYFRQPANPYDLATGRFGVALKRWSSSKIPRACDRLCAQRQDAKEALGRCSDCPMVVDDESAIGARRMNEFLNCQQLLPLED